MSAPTRPAVLLVDDEPRVLSALQRCLRREPCELQTASSPREALALLERAPADLVISDYRMPGMNGIEFLQAVRKTWPDTARILLSGWASEITSADRKAAGLSAVLAKPWDDRELRHAIRDALGLEVK